METNQEKMDAKIVANNEHFEVLRGTLVSRVDIYQAMTEANQREMTAKMAAWIERKEDCVGKLVANREKSGAVATHPEVPNEEAEVETIGALEDRYGKGHLAVRRRLQRRNGPRAMVGPGRSWPPSAY
jgi:hypothetical protein